MKKDNVETEHVEKHQEEKLLREKLKLSIFLMKHLKKNDLTDLDSKIVVNAQAVQRCVENVKSKVKDKVKDEVKRKVNDQGRYAIQSGQC